MELLVIKSTPHYIKVTNGAYEMCALEKASVFPIKLLTQVKTHVRNLKNNGFSNIQINKLTISETPFID